MVKPKGIMIAANVQLGKNSLIYHRDLVNLCGYEIGDGCTIGGFARIRTKAKISRNVRIQDFCAYRRGCSHSGWGLHRSLGVSSQRQISSCCESRWRVVEAEDWKIVPTLLKRAPSIGAEATIIGVITVGEYAMVGAGVVITCGVPAYGIVAGGPPRVVGHVGE